MGLLSSAQSWFQNHINRINAHLDPTFSSVPPSLISLNSNTQSLGTPIKIGSGGLEFYNPIIDPFLPYRKSTEKDYTESIEKDQAASDTEVGGPGNNPSPLPYPHSSVGITVPKLAEFDFINAELAKHYGMSKSTAYQEALANTAYQRAVKDMKAAGLNPGVIFGNGRATTANSAIYGQEAISGGSGGSYRRSGSGSKNDKLFSSDTYAMISGAGALIGGLIGAKTGNIGLGALTGSNIATSSAKVLNGIYQKYK